MSKIMVCVWVFLFAGLFKGMYERSKLKNLRQMQVRSRIDNKIYACTGPSKYSCVEWKGADYNQQAIFVATHLGTIVVFDIYGKELTELCVPQEFDYFLVSENSIELSYRGEKTSYLLSEIQWFGSGRPLQLPTGHDVEIKLILKKIYASISSEFGKKVLRLKQQIPHFAFNLGWYITRLFCVVYYFVRALL